MHIEGLLVRSKVFLRDVLREALNAEGINKVHPVTHAPNLLKRQDPIYVLEAYLTPITT